MTYNSVCNKFLTDKGDLLPDGNGYANFYDLWFAKMRHTCTNILEIGVDRGYSLMANYEYFPNANIIGLDIREKKEFENDRIKTHVLNQDSIVELKNFQNFCTEIDLKFDIIIDDGSHLVSHQQSTFGIFFSLVKPGGYYIIEDLGSSYLTLGEKMYGYTQTQQHINNNTINFLNQRPFYSPWIFQNDLDYINDNVEYVTIYDRINENLTYKNNFKCVNNVQIRSITSVIKKNDK